MSQTFFAILTAVGEAKLANATALGTTVQFTQMAVGDGNGAPVVPVRTQTTLVREQRRAAINTLFVDPQNASQIVAEQVIPEDVGGWWIREIGLFDAAGDLCAVANCPDTYKPVLAEGSGRTQVIRMVLIVANATSVQLKIDPAIVLATRGYADSKVLEHEQKADPHPQYLTTAEGDTAIAAAVAALVNSSPTTLDTLAELATALGNDPNFATTLTNLLALKAPLASPALTGNPTAPTSGQFDNDTSIANTAFVQRAIGNSSGGAVLTVATVLTAADFGKLIVATSAGGFTITLPAASAGVVGATIEVTNTAPAAITVQRASADVMYVTGTSRTSLIIQPGESAAFKIISGTEWEIIGTAALKHASSFSASLVTNGYQKYPSGLIEQWGYSVVTAGAINTISFPIAFPTALLNVDAVSANGDSAASTVGVALNSGTPTASFRVRAEAGTSGVYWKAKGY